MEMKWSISLGDVWASVQAVKAPGLPYRGWHFIRKDARCSQNPAHTSARLWQRPLAGEPRPRMGGRGTALGTASMDPWIP